MAGGKPIVGIKFGVDPGSAKDIKAQLEKLASEIKIDVLEIKINEDHFNAQLDKLQKDLKKKLGEVEINLITKTATQGKKGGSSETAIDETTQYKTIRDELFKIYNLKEQLKKQDIGSRRYIELQEYINDSKQKLEEQYKILQDISKEGSAGTKQIIELNKQLNTAKEKTSEQSIASKTSIARMESKAQSLSTDNGYDKIIARDKEAQKLVEDFQNKVNAVLKSSSKVTKDQIQDLNAEFLKTETRLKEIGQRTDTVGNKLKEAFSAHVIQRLAHVLLMAIVRAFAQVYKNVVEINTAMTELKIVTSATTKEMEQSFDRVADAAKRIGSSVKDLIESVTVYARLGYGLKEAELLAEKTTVYANVAGVNVDDATKNITGAIKAYNLDINEIETTLDKFIWVGNKFAISQAEIGEAMNDAASALKGTGNSLNEAIGILTAANASVQDVSKVATGVRTISARISGSEAELIELGENAGDVISRAKLHEKMQAFGVAIIDANGELRSTYDILNDLSKKWKELNPTERAAIGEMFAGNRQRNVFNSMMDNWSDAQKVVEDMASSTGSLQEANEKYLDSIQGRANQLKAAWEEFSNNLLDSDLVKLLFNILRYLAEILNIVVSAGDGILVKMPAIAGIIILVIRLVTKLKDAIGNAIVNSIDFNTSLDEIGKYGKKAQSGVKGLASSAMALSAAFAAFTVLSIVFEQVEGTAGDAAKAVVGGITAITAAIMAFQASNPVGWITLAISGVMMLVQGIADVYGANSFKQLAEKAKESKDAWEEANDALGETKTKLQQVQDEIDKLNAKEIKTAVDDEELERLHNELQELNDLKKKQEDDERAEQRNAITDAENALDAYKRENSLGNASTLGGFIQLVTFKLDHGNTEDIREAIGQYEELLSGFEYGTNQKLNNYFDEYYFLLDKYNGLDQGAAEVWSSITHRTKNKEAVDALKNFANQYRDTSKITGEELEELANKTPEVQELFNYLQTVGIWDGENWDKLTGLVGDLRTGLVELAGINVVDDIELITDKFDSLSNALSDVSENGILSLGTLQTMMDKYPSLLNTYFTKTSDGYKKADLYSEMSDFEIMQDVALKDIASYRKRIDDARLTLFGGIDEDGKTVEGLGIDDDDYETALKNYATAQDNLNTKTLEWASALREVAIEDETKRLEGIQEVLTNRLDTYKELIDIRKDLLQTYKEEVDYQKELAKRQKTVSDLQTQLSLAKLDNSSAGQARVKELESQLQEAEDELDDYTLERAIKDITQTLDAEYNEYDKFIKEKVKDIGEEIENIAKTLNNILDVEEANDLNNVEMINLRSKINSEIDSITKKGNDANSTEKEFLKNATDSNGDIKKFIDSVSEGNFEEANKYYAEAKKISDSYKPEQPKPQKDGNPNDMTLIPGAYASGITVTEPGNNGSVTLKNGTEYQVENEGIEQSLVKAAYQNFGDRDVFYYEGGLYACLDGTVVKLKEMDWWNYTFGGIPSKQYDDLLDAAKKQIGIHHNGGFIGDFATLKSNEEFAKLLKGEFVSTPKQMDDFMRQILPAMLSYSGLNSGTVVNNSPLIEIKCGNINDDTMPKLKDLVNQAVEKIEKNMESALSRTGHKKKY